MASYNPPKKNTAYTMYLGLRSQADTKLFQTNPTLATGDVKVSKDGGSLANVTTLPTAVSSSAIVKLDLSSTEMNADNIAVIFSDASGAQWCDLLINLQTTARQFDDLASQASVDTIDDYVDTEMAAALAAVDTEVAAIKAKTDLIPASPAAVGSAMTLAADAVNSTSLAASAVTEMQSGLATAAALQTVDDLVDELETRLTALRAGYLDNLSGGAVATATALATLAAYVDTEVAAILAAVDTEVAAIKAKTDNLPTDPADDSDIDTQLAALAAYLDTEIAAILAAVDTEVAAIKAKTDLIPASPAAVGSAMTLAADAVNSTSLAASAVTEMQSGLATAAALQTVDDLVDELETRLTALRAGYLDNLSGGAVATATALATLAAYVDTEVAAILAAVDTEVAAIKAKTDNLPTDPADDSDIDTQLAALAAYLDTEIAAILAAVDTEVAAIKAKTDLIPASPAAVGSAMTLAADAVNSTSLAASAVAEIQSGLSTLSAAQVNAEVVDALATDTYAEPSSVPAATASLKDKINFIHAALRNKRLTTATTDTIRNDADSAAIGAATLGDDGTTFTRGEYA